MPAVHDVVRVATFNVALLGKVAGDVGGASQADIDELLKAFGGSKPEEGGFKVPPNPMTSDAESARTNPTPPGLSEKTLDELRAEVEQKKQKKTRRADAPAASKPAVPDLELPKLLPGPKPPASLVELLKGPHPAFPGIPARGQLADIADTALRGKSLLAPGIPQGVEGLNAELERLAKTPKPLDALGRPVPHAAPEIPTATRRLLAGVPTAAPPRPVVGSLPRTRMSGALKGLGLLGLGAGAATFAPGAYNAMTAKPVPPKPDVEVSPWALAGGLAGLTGLGVGAYMLNNALKSKKSKLDRLDEDAEVD